LSELKAKIRKIRAIRDQKVLAAESLLTKKIHEEQS